MIRPRSRLIEVNKTGPYLRLAYPCFLPTLVEPSEQGVVTAMCLVLRSATAIKMKSRDQAHRQATIKESRRILDHKSDQNQDDFAMLHFIKYFI